MPDLKTVTFDASQWQLVPKEPTKEMRDQLSKQDIEGIESAWQWALEEAPTPAAQSAGQEPLAFGPWFSARLEDGSLDHHDLKCAEFVFNECAKMCAAQSAGQEAVALTDEQILAIAVHHFKKGYDSSPKSLAAFCDCVRAVITAYAAPVNGGERDAAPKPVPVNTAWTRHQSGDYTSADDLIAALDGGDEREAFEREYADHGESALARVGESYMSPVTNALWKGWQARAALSADGGDRKDAEQFPALAQLLAAHASELESNAYAYFELAYTRHTDWMAWICSNSRESDPGRKVIARGQGATPEEACRAAVAAKAAKGE